MNSPKKALVILLQILVSSCHFNRVLQSEGLDFDSLAKYEGQKVTIKGYVSRRSEAYGIYLSLRDFDALRARCVAVELNYLERYSHGEKVIATGILKKSPCQKEMICVTACGRYDLELESSVPAGSQ